MKKRERCVSEGVLQAHIDGELSSSEQELVMGHLRSCTACESRFREMAQWSESVKIALPSVVRFEDDIPVFTPEPWSVGTAARRKMLTLIPGAAALIVLGFFTWLMVTDTKQKGYEPTSYDFLVWEESAAGNDANRLWHNRSVTIMITSPEGEVEIINLN